MQTFGRSRIGSLRGGAIGVLATLLLIGSLFIHSASSRAADAPATLSDYVDPSQVITDWQKSQWAQPWRSYMETVPASTFINAVGINFNVEVWRPGVAEATARLLADNGFTRARIEIGWGALDYNDPSKLTAAALKNVVPTIAAMRKYGIRPLITLNANSGGPCPVKLDTVTLTAAARKGATEIHVSPSDVSKIVPGKTGIRSGGTSANYLFKSVTPDGTVQLSAPLGEIWQSTTKTKVIESLDAGPLEVETLLYEPFQAEKLADGTPNPAFNRTMQGWLSYVGVVTNKVKELLGSEEFDVEVWNELSFGSRFLELRDYYRPSIGEGLNGGWNEDAILKGTVDYIRDPAHGVPNIGIGNGFSNQSPGWGPEDSPAGLTAQDKHPYAGARFFPSGEGTEGLRPLNGLGEQSGTSVPPGLWKAAFTPTYTAFFPEYYLSAIPNQTLTRDLSPTPTWYAGSMHGRNVNTPGGGPLEHWITEVNLNPKGGYVPNLSARDIRHIQAKSILRYLVAYVNKGMTAIDFFAASDTAFGLVEPEFFSSLRSHPTDYPGVTAAGETIEAVGRLTKGFSDGPITSHRELTLDSLTQLTDNRQFNGNGTPQYPPLYNRDVFAFLPFQASQSRFVIPVYVMTRNVSQNYQSTDSTDPTRFDLPAEPYRMVIGGIDGSKTDVSASDPLTGDAIPVEVLARSDSDITVEMPVTDSPRLLTIQEGVPPVEPPPTEPPPTVEPPQGGTTPPAHGPKKTAPNPSGQGKGSADSAPVTGLQILKRANLLRDRRVVVTVSCSEECRLVLRGKVLAGKRTFAMRAISPAPGFSPAGSDVTAYIGFTKGTRNAIQRILARGLPVNAEINISAVTTDGTETTFRRKLAVRP